MPLLPPIPSAGDLAQRAQATWEWVLHDPGMNGAAGGALCGGASLGYAALRASGGKDPVPHPRQPAIIGIYLAEEALGGGLAGALTDSPRNGFATGAAATCGFDLFWVIVDESSADEPALLEGGPAGWKVGIPAPGLAPDRLSLRLLTVHF